MCYYCGTTYMKRNAYACHRVLFFDDEEKA